MQSLGAEDKPKSMKVSVKGAPRYSLQPTYRLGTLIAAAFFVSAATGLVMASYYMATPQEAYASTLRIYRRLPYGGFILTVHVYSAYALVVLYFANMARSYFVSAYAKPRELIWVLDFFSYLVVIGLCFTGFLLPWFDSSKLFTDASIRFVKSLPSGTSVASLLFGEGDAELLTRFFRLHTMGLPLLFSGLLLLKLCLHLKLGVPEQISKYPEENSEEILPWFPSVASYLILISSVLIAGILVVSAVFPFALPDEFSANAVVSPPPYLQWYLLWIYHLMKMFDGAAARTAVFSMILLLGIVLLLLPFLDKPKKKHPYDRPVHTALGILLIIEVSLLTVWGLMPHSFLPTPIEASIILGLPILAVIVYVFMKESRSRT